MQPSRSDKGTIFLIPSTLGPEGDLGTIPASVLTRLDSLTHFVAEDARTARRFLKRIGIRQPLQDLEIFVLDKHTDPAQVNEYLDIPEKGEDLGVLTEAGCPGIADPGAELVAGAHERGIAVVPLVGPCSFVLALMASGMNGQRFAFSGYLPRETNKRKQQIAQLERRAENETQIFMDTPYRSQKLFEQLVSQLRMDTLLCVACDLTTPHEMVRTAPVHWWKKQKIHLGKRPCVFLLSRQATFL